MKIIVLIIVAAVIVGLLFYFYKEKHSNVPANHSDKESSYNNYINKKLLDSLTTKYPELEFSLTGDSIISKTGLIVKAVIANHRKYDTGESFQINFFTSYKNFFDKPIEERLAGLGEDETTALQNGLQSFLTGQFPVIIDGINMKHAPDMDFDIIHGNGKIHWHPIIGEIQLQGELSKMADSSIYDNTYQFIKPVLLEKLKNSNQAFHWFRYYISKMPDGEIIGDCYYDNDPCDAGMELLKKYASTWKTADKFSGQKQFILLRKCGE